MIKIVLLTTRRVWPRELSTYLDSLVLDAHHPREVIEELRKNGKAKWDDGDVITEYSIEVEQ